MRLKEAFHEIHIRHKRGDQRQAYCYHLCNGRAAKHDRRRTWRPFCRSMPSRSSGLNEFQAGILWGVQVVTTILSKPIMGKTSDKYGRKPLITVGLIICAVSFGLIPAVQGLLSAHDYSRFLWSGRGALSNRQGLRLWLISARKSISALPWGPSGRSLISAMQQGLFSQGFSLRATVTSSHSG